MDGALRRVDDEVPQREAEALRGAPQAERFGSRPGEGLLVGPEGGHGRRLALIAPILLLGLRGGETKGGGVRVKQSAAGSQLA